MAFFWATSDVYEIKNHRNTAVRIENLLKKLIWPTELTIPSYYQKAESVVHLHISFCRYSLRSITKSPYTRHVSSVISVAYTDISK